jgi:hypothetical protein
MEIHVLFIKSAKVAQDFSDAQWKLQPAGQMAVRHRQVM